MTRAVFAKTETDGHLVLYWMTPRDAEARNKLSRRPAYAHVTDVAKREGIIITGANGRRYRLFSDASLSEIVIEEEQTHDQRRLFKVQLPDKDAGARDPQTVYVEIDPTGRVSISVRGNDGRTGAEARVEYCEGKVMLSIWTNGDNMLCSPRGKYVLFP